MTNFVRIVPVLSSNSESVRKIGTVFAYELRFDVPYIKIDQKKFLIDFDILNVEIRVRMWKLDLFYERTPN